MPRCTATYAPNWPTIVLPAPVGAATSTEFPASTASSASIWKGSGVKLNPSTQRARSDAAARAYSL